MVILPSAAKQRSLLRNLNEKKTLNKTGSPALFLPLKDEKLALIQVGYFKQNFDFVNIEIPEHRPPSFGRSEGKRRQMSSSYLIPEDGGIINEMAKRNEEGEPARKKRGRPSTASGSNFGRETTSGNNAETSTASGSNFESAATSEYPFYIIVIKIVKLFK
uniref:Uncharacterized protein n=1 Tax=Panagrolaimus superbus TaxID=310955 RepID=A0A914YIL3_9BILA